MFRKVLLPLVALLLFVGVRSTQAQAQAQELKIGYMNPQEVLNQLPERSKIEQQLNDYIEQKRSELEQKTMDFQKRVEDYQNTRDSLGENQRGQQEQELQQMNQQLEQYRQNVQQQIQQKRAELLQPIYQRMNQAIAAVAETKNLDFVLNEMTGYGDNIIFYASRDDLNITDEVINRMTSGSNSDSANNSNN